MNSIKFPKMFKGNSTQVVKESREATLECLKLLLSTEHGEMFGDPEFGIRLKRYMFEQNNFVLRDILIDEIYEQIALFCPQITVTRRDIKIEQVKNKVLITIKAINKIDFTTSTYDLVLYDVEER